MRLFIEPVEPLLFRTGRPFDAGENNFAESMFPPTPETLQGAVRATIAAHWSPGKTIAEAFGDNQLTALIGDTTGYGRFRITGLSLGRYKKADDKKHIERIFPMPVHLLEEDGGEKKQAILLPKLSEGKAIHTNLPDTMRLLYPEPNLDDLNGKVEPMRGWLTEPVLQRILNTPEQVMPDKFLRTEKRGEEKEVISDSDIFVRESRLGIGMNNRTKTTEEGLLYQVEMIRMNHQYKSDYIYGFVVDVRLATTVDGWQLIDDKKTQDELHLPKTGWMILGGERRAAQFEVIAPSSENQSTAQQAYNMLYLATPAVLSRGWQPSNWNSVQPERKPIAVAINRYLPIGGWLLNPKHAGGENKVIHRCVPAGTIYYFDEAVHIERPLTEHGAKIGYGITFGGNWKQ